MSSSQDPFGGDQGASAEAVGLFQMEQQGHIPGELRGAGRESSQNVSVGAVWVAGDNPAEDREVVQETRRLPYGCHRLPVQRSHCVGHNGSEEGAQENSDHFHIAHECLSTD